MTAVDGSGSGSSTSRPGTGPEGKGPTLQGVPARREFVTAGQSVGREACTQLWREAAEHRPIARAYGDHDLGPLARRELDLAQLMRAGQQPAPRGAVQVLQVQRDRVHLAAGVSRHTAHAAQTGRWLVESASWRTLVAALLAQCLQ